MALIDTIIRVIHTVFAGAWAGGTLLFVGAVLPAARANHFDARALSTIAKRFSYLSVAAVALLFITGGHLAGRLYTFGSLQSTGRGHLVVSMVVLWLVLAGVSHAATSQLTSALETGDTKTAVENSWGLYLVAAMAAAALLVIAGLL
ncbi:CopD family protein [Haladaptatus caseinilyticus]|uniref:CopD family protein n=1 Tax=Haladaptatus caseinilyticus TaxID=2993314 RepID=UPI00224B4044|nr:CopD family protein [Haladaptatus caseinilyticus]